jgi:acetyltransferase-like isoleucine patch superfamily enzyme
VVLETGKIDKEKFAVYIKKTSPLVEEGELKIGKSCHISKNVVIQAQGGVFIGDFTGIASGAKIYSLSHHYKNLANDDGRIYKFTPLAPPGDQSLIQGTVVFEGNNALGLNSVVLPGVTIGKNSWVGTCSNVVDDLPPSCVATGCPAKVIKWLNNR